MSIRCSLQSGTMEEKSTAAVAVAAAGPGSKHNSNSSAWLLMNAIDIEVVTVESRVNEHEASKALPFPANHILSKIRPRAISPAIL